MKEITINYPADKLFTIQLPDEDSHAQILENVFASCNYGSGQECEEFKNGRMRSLSVNDFVKIDNQWYQCESIGWKAVTEEYVNEIEELVINHPKYSLYGGWTALNDIMWSKRKK
jgi:hypothetical protein